MKTKPENKAKNTGHMQALNKLAGEINAKLASANASEKLAHDTRLAAAVMLAEAEKTCKLAGLSFKEWCAKHLDKSWETARKLAAIGKSDNPEQALQQQRANNSASMKAARSNARDTAPKLANSSGVTLPKGNAMPSASPDPLLTAVNAFKSALSGVDKMQRECILRNMVQDFGYTLTPALPAIVAQSATVSVSKH